MRKIVSLLLLVVFVFVSCATQVPITYEKAAKYEMREYRDLTVELVEPYPFNVFDSSTKKIESTVEEIPFIIYPTGSLFSERRLAELTTKHLTDKLSKSNYFTLTNYGSAHLTSRISRMNFTQYVYEKVVEEGKVEYYLRQRGEMTLSFAIIDSKWHDTIYKDSLSESFEVDKKLNLIEDLILFAPDPLIEFEKLSISLTEKVVNLLAPQKITTYVSLMKNKPENFEAQKAYEVAKQRLYPLAAQMFLEVWDNYNHYPSAYNAALLKEAMGQREEAILLMEKLYASTFDSKVLRQLNRMVRYQMEEELAKQQY